MKISTIKQISRLSKLSKAQLRKINAKNEPAYKGKELTKYQLIYQIVFLKDAPND